MRNKFFLFILTPFLSIAAKAQTISFTLVDEGNKNFCFYIPNGLKTDTLVRGRVNMLGQGKVIIPDRYKGVAAMGVLDVADGVKQNLILEDKDFSISVISGQQPVFTGSEENDLLYNKQQDIMNKENENTFAQFYVKILNSVSKASRIVAQPNSANLFERTSARLSLVNDADVDKLYYSRFWFYTIDGILQLSISQEAFADDMIKLLEKTKTERVYTALVEDIIMITNQFGLDDAFDKVLLHVKDSGKIKYPQGIIFDAFKMLKVRKGTTAPALVGLSHSVENYDYSLLIFHQPGCDHCHEQLRLLNENLKFFKEKKVRIVSISGDMDEKSFEEESKTFLWNDKLCDYKGFAGNNFTNFGVIATPILYLVDAKDLVLGRFGTVDAAKKCLTDSM